MFEDQSNREIIHFVLDEKFIDMAIRQFESAALTKNRYVMLVNFRERKLRYVKNTNIQFCTLAEAKNIINLESSAAVIFHALVDDFIPLLREVPAGKNVIWLGWGYDYYDRLLSGAYPNGLLLPKTKKLISKNGLFDSGRTALLLKALIKRMLNLSEKFTVDLANRVDYFCPVFDIEFDMAKKLNPHLKSEYICWNYATLENDLISNDVSCDCFGEDVLVGNSATPENNHLEVFDLLRSHEGIRNRRIIVPLSYGNMKYRDRISSIGREYFGDSFVPLFDFMPKDKYFHILNQCGFVFMNQLRQQGTGNIGIMMMRGAKVFMNPISPAYKWFIKEDFVVHSIDALESKDTQTWSHLDKQAREKNIELMHRHWGNDAQRKKTQKLIKVALRLSQVG